MKRLAILSLLLWDLPAHGSEVRESVFKIRAAGCVNGQEHVLTGSVIAGYPGILTSLHGVVGCKIISAEQAGGLRVAFQGLRLSRADVAHDIAILSGDETLDVIPSLPKVSREFLQGPLQVWGFPREVANALSTRVSFRKDPYVSWESMTPEARAQIQRRGSPSISARMLSIEGHITDGHSGAPVLSGDGHVVGIANGGLANGTLEIALATPVWDLNFSSTEGLRRDLDRLAGMDPGDLFTSVASSAPREEFEREGVAFSEEEFLRRVQSGDLNMATRLVDSGISPTARGGTGQSALVLAASNLDTAMIQMLLSRRIDLEGKRAQRRDSDGWLALRAALGRLLGTSKEEAESTMISAQLDLAYVDFVVSQPNMAATAPLPEALVTQLTTNRESAKRALETIRLLLSTLHRRGSSSVSGLTASEG